LQTLSSCALYLCAWPALAQDIPTGAAASPLFGGATLHPADADVRGVWHKGGADNAERQQHGVRASAQLHAVALGRLKSTK